MKEKTRQEVVVEKGMTDRQRIILAGAGDEEVHVCVRQSTWLILMKFAG